ncbi:hypothetical protein CFP56_000206 [Quercus suber]|uniref:Uncharacterized protein n=1 Tax=Quercus suber TaxID=58331 RepID=A0AAW0MDZ9_QUESU|nr:hypothetical protein CFP56_60452 [Quercus suber]
MDSRERSMCGPLISQPILLVPQSDSFTNINLGSDRDGPARTPHGVDDNGASVLQGDSRSVLIGGVLSVDFAGDSGRLVSKIKE